MSEQRVRHIELAMRRISGRYVLGISTKETTVISPDDILELCSTWRKYESYRSIGSDK